MGTREFFSTPIYLENLVKSSSLTFAREIKEQCHLIRKIDDEGVRWSEENYVNGYTSYGSLTDLHLNFPHFIDLKKLLMRHVRKFARHLELDLQGGQLEMSSCWVNIMSKGSHHSLHLHPLSVISGTYYVSVPKGSSRIKFEDPRLAFMMAAPPKIERTKKPLFVTLEPRTGQVGLWESWLRHEVPVQKSTQDRISISFNFDWVAKKL